MNDSPSAVPNTVSLEKLAWLTAITACLYLLGFFSPMMTLSKHVEKFWIVFVDEKNTVSLYSALGELYASGSYFIFILISAFAVAFPIAKMLLCGVLVLPDLDRKIKRKITDFLYHAGKWSMLDVFVAGILVVVVKLGSVAEVTLHSGVFWFALSVLSSFLMKAEASKILNSKR